jgi:hypothetical protein
MTFDLRAAARAHCPAALRVVAAAMQSEDGEIRARAAQVMLRFGHMIEASCSRASTLPGGVAGGGFAAVAAWCRQVSRRGLRRTVDPRLAVPRRALFSAAT